MATQLMRDHGLSGWFTLAAVAHTGGTSSGMTFPERLSDRGSLWQSKPRLLELQSSHFGLAFA